MQIHIFKIEIGFIFRLLIQIMNFKSFVKSEAKVLIWMQFRIFKILILFWIVDTNYEF